MRKFRALLEDLKISLLKADRTVLYMHRSCMMLHAFEILEGTVKNYILDSQTKYLCSS